MHAATQLGLLHPAPGGLAFAGGTRGYAIDVSHRRPSYIAMPRQRNSQMAPRAGRMRSTLQKQCGPQTTPHDTERQGVAAPS
jgi:hypothetical protein